MLKVGTPKLITSTVIEIEQYGLNAIFLKDGLANSVNPGQIAPGEVGAPVAQWVKRWPNARGEIFSTVNGALLHTAFHFQPPIVLI